MIDTTWNAQISKAEIRRHELHASTIAMFADRTIGAGVGRMTLDQASPNTESFVCIRVWANTAHTRLAIRPIRYGPDFISVFLYHIL
jgi:hypothetical protein